MDDTFIVGSPQECVEQIGRYRELGFTHISLRTCSIQKCPQKKSWPQIEPVGKEVSPAVHDHVTRQPLQT